ncbi:MAG: hypothetical protein CW338_05045 [Clostridiales bacterium]|nr:hypothetical protein [Clostridiales bacterium]
MNDRRCFRIRLAGRVFGMTCLHGQLYSMCTGYLTDDPADFSIVISQQDIDAERDSAEGSHADAYLETLAAYRRICTVLSAEDTLLIHGSAIAVGQSAYLFTAPSGTGKTTHSNLWMEHIAGAYWVNGDKPLVTVTEEGAVVHGTPWCGKEHKQTNTSVPLKAIIILKRGGENSIRAVTPAEAFGGVFGQVFKPQGEGLVSAVRLFEKLTRQVKFYEMHCNMDPEAAVTAWETLSRL